MIYLDHSATTPVDRRVVAAMLPYWTESYGNPSSLYGPGRRARQAVDQSRRAIGQILGCAADEIVFTGSGSEGANLAIKGVALSAPSHRRQIVPSRVEHHVVLESCQELARVHAPIGLSIGAVSPEEIAVSILAELIAVRRGLDPRSARPGPWAHCQQR